MSTRSFIVNQIRERAAILRLTKRLSPERARHLAAKEIGQEQREQRTVKATRPLPAPHNGKGEITAQNAGSILYAKLSALIHRMDEPSSPRPRSPRVPWYKPQPDQVQSPQPAAPPSPAPAPEPESNVLAFPSPFVSGINGTTLIDDREYHTSLHDHTTQNWRASIERNERAAREHEARRRGFHIG